MSRDASVAWPPVKLIDGLLAIVMESMLMPEIGETKTPLSAQTPPAQRSVVPDPATPASLDLIGTACALKANRLANAATAIFVIFAS